MFPLMHSITTFLRMAQAFNEAVKWGAVYVKERSISHPLGEAVGFGRRDARPLAQQQAQQQRSGPIRGDLSEPMSAVRATPRARVSLSVSRRWCGLRLPVCFRCC